MNILPLVILLAEVIALAKRKKDRDRDRDRKKHNIGMVETAVELSAPGTTPPRAATPAPARKRSEQNK